MEKTLLSLLSLALFFGVSYWYVLDSQWCCSYHWWIDYVGTQWWVLCSDWTVSECIASYRGLCTDYWIYWDSAEAYYYSFYADQYTDTANRIKWYLQKFQSVVDSQAHSISNASDSLTRSRWVKSEVVYRDLACQEMETLFIADMSKSNTQQICASYYSNVAWWNGMPIICKTSYYQYNWPILTEREKEKVENAIKKWDAQANKWYYGDAAWWYKDARDILADKVEFASLVAQLDDVIKELKEKQKLANELREMQWEAEKTEKAWNKLTEQYQKAIEYGSWGDYDKAIKELEKIIKNEWTIERWDNYELAKQALSIYKEWKAKLDAAEKAWQEVQKEKAVEEVEKAKKYLWEKAPIVESIATALQKKEERIQTKIKKVCETFSKSNDEYTRSIGVYLGSLME